ncbi:hypothetical protein WSK_4229 [Novosphingobium sp. Rr 2-17]|uniref:DUF6356 family protein n=1 Tax=Novosphingobium sp. Rr 2-17 TaxID=555793 RepID=UPI000269A8A4|nr:DUF6356 family protein [Novosphingobium sp. Rr 2-17]EIZ77237.1 hypothetical protein WSK_4229 [Novosphingobium sp. Rr 2-17]
MFRRIFKDHPHSVGETYLEHAQSAFGFGTALLGAGIKCLIHGLLPTMFTTSGSDTVRRLYSRMVTDRRKDNGAA